MKHKKMLRKGMHMHTIIGMAAIAAMLLLSLPDDARSAESSAVDASRSTVQVEVRFIEITQKDLYPSDMRSTSGSESNTVSPRGKMDQTIRHPDSSGGGGSNALALARVLTNSDLSLVLHALEQRDGVNLLSAPKVVTESGKNAEIKVVREVRYPASS